MCFQPALFRRLYRRWESIAYNNSQRSTLDWTLVMHPSNNERCLSLFIIADGYTFCLLAGRRTVGLFRVPQGPAATSTRSTKAASNDRHQQPLIQQDNNEISPGPAKTCSERETDYINNVDSAAPIFEQEQIVVTTVSTARNTNAYAWLAFSGFKSLQAPPYWESRSFGLKRLWLMVCTAYIKHCFS